MMEYKRILTVQDISCLGQCSLTVALPILSACGQETCVLPTAVLSTHTGGFSRPAIRDLTELIPDVQRHWQAENVAFDGIYTGYLGSKDQIDLVQNLFETALRPGGNRIVDPAMADHGKLYAGFDKDFVAKMRTLCAQADVLIPNLTEAAMLADLEYDPDGGEAYVRTLLEKLHRLGPKAVVITGISFQPGMTGVLISREGTLWQYSHPKLGKGCHGTGDAFAACFTGVWMGGRTMEEAARIAADFVCDCIRLTREDPAHWYGAKFEMALPGLIKRLYG